MTDWKAFAVYIIRSMSKKHKYGQVHTIEEANLRKGLGMSNRQDRRAFDEALKYLIGCGLVLFKSKDYAKGGRAYFLNPSRSADISRIFERNRLFD